MVNGRVRSLASIRRTTFAYRPDSLVHIATLFRHPLPHGASSRRARPEFQTRFATILPRGGPLPGANFVDYVHCPQNEKRPPPAQEHHDGCDVLQITNEMNIANTTDILIRMIRVNKLNKDPPPAQEHHDGSDVLQISKEMDLVRHLQTVFVGISIKLKQNIWLRHVFRSEYHMFYLDLAAVLRCFTSTLSREISCSVVKFRLRTCGAWSNWSKYHRVLRLKLLETQSQYVCS
jgi:hypothetical protein